MTPGPINGLTTTQETTSISILPLAQSEATCPSLILCGSQQVGCGRIVFTIIKTVVCVEILILVATTIIGVEVAVMTAAVVAVFTTADTSKDGTTIPTLAPREPNTTLPQQTSPTVSQSHL